MKKYFCSNLTNKYNPQEPPPWQTSNLDSSNLTNKYNPQEPGVHLSGGDLRSNLTNKYNPQEPGYIVLQFIIVQILPINTILKNMAPPFYRRN